MFGWNAGRHPLLPFATPLGPSVRTGKLTASSWEHWSWEYRPRCAKSQTFKLDVSSSARSAARPNNQTWHRAPQATAPGRSQRCNPHQPVMRQLIRDMSVKSFLDPWRCLKWLQRHTHLPQIWDKRTETGRQRERTHARTQTMKPLRHATTHELVELLRAGDCCCPLNGLPGFLIACVVASWPDCLCGACSVLLLAGATCCAADC